jgi:hypothetical protein
MRVQRKGCRLHHCHVRNTPPSTPRGISTLALSRNMTIKRQQNLTGAFRAPVLSFFPLHIRLAGGLFSLVHSIRGCWTSYVSHMGSLVMGHPALTIHHMVWAQPDSRFDYRTPLLMGRPDPEQSSSSYGPAVGNNAPHEWSGGMFVDSHFLCGAALRRRVMITFGMRRRQSSH